LTIPAGTLQQVFRRLLYHLTLVGFQVEMVVKLSFIQILHSFCGQFVHSFWDWYMFLIIYFIRCVSHSWHSTKRKSVIEISFSENLLFLFYLNVTMWTDNNIYSIWTLDDHLLVDTFDNFQIFIFYFLVRNILKCTRIKIQNYIKQKFY